MPAESDEWPDEPDEPDPESRWGSPEDDLVSVPRVDIPGESGDDGGAGIDVDGEIAKFFWGAVVYANVGVGGVSLGLLLVGFRGQWLWGGAAAGIGLLALYRTYDLYGRYQTYVVADDDGE